MKVQYKNGNTLVYPKGASLAEIKAVIEKRMKKRDEELKKREWIVKEYRSLQAKQAEDNQWLQWLNTQDPDKWGKDDEEGEDDTEEI